MRLPGTLLKLWPDFEGNCKTASVFWIVRRFIDSHRQAGVQQSLGKQGSIMPNCDLRETSTIILNTPIPSSSLTFIYWAWHHLVCNIPWIIWGQLSWLCPSQFLVHPQPPVREVREAEKALMGCKHCSATKIPLYYQCCFQHTSQILPHTPYCEKN